MSNLHAAALGAVAAWTPTVLFLAVMLWHDFPGPIIEEEPFVPPENGHWGPWGDLSQDVQHGMDPITVRFTDDHEVED